MQRVVETQAITAPKPSMSRRTKLWILGLSLIGSISFAVSEFHHWDERLFFDLKSQLNAAAWKDKSI
ncbi:hypothetical protein FBY03_12076 [Pseudomonas sp. SJZ079]|nr:hypothetical protein FBY03_12076 [Pseudomonas sp. SJZ079]